MTLLAHILQGYEAFAVDLAMQEYDVELLCFDGFITREAVDTRYAEERFFQLTGMEIEYSHDKLQANAR